MTWLRTLRVEALSASHARKDFDCGVTVLNAYLRQQSTQDVRRNVSRVFVACAEGSFDVIGFYTLSATAVERDELPEQEAGRLPRYPVPSALLGRLAVDSRHQGQGIGKFLLADACRRVVLASEALAVYALLVDAKDEHARAFYAGYGFTPFPKTPSRLYLALETLRRSMV